MRLIRFKDSGDICPRWWGMCWRDYANNRVAIAPLGANIVFAVCNWLYEWVAFRIVDWIDRSRPWSG